MRDVTLRREEQLRVEQEDGGSVEMANADFMGISWKKIMGTLWWTNGLQWKMAIFHGKIHYFYGLFSIAMLVHQRVLCNVGPPLDS